MIKSKLKKMVHIETENSDYENYDSDLGYNESEDESEEESEYNDDSDAEYNNWEEEEEGEEEDQDEFTYEKFIEGTKKLLTTENNKTVLKSFIELCIEDSNSNLIKEYFNRDISGIELAIEEIEKFDCDHEQKEKLKNQFMELCY